MTKKQMRWDVPAETFDLIARIVRRAIASPSLRLSKHDSMELQMDLIAVHRNGTPLRLRELAEADFFNFAHDIAGIRYHLNRETGELEHCFVPRFAQAS